MPEETEGRELGFPKTLYDPYAEAACLGAMLTGSDLAIEVLDMLAAEDFGTGENWRVLRAAEELHQARFEISFVTLRDALERRSWLERVGGEGALLLYGERMSVDAQGVVRLLADEKVMFSSVAAACRAVKEKANARRLVRSLETAAAGLKELRQTSSDAAEQVRDAILKLDLKVENRAKSAAEVSVELLDHIHAVRYGQVVAEPTGFQGFDRATGGLRGGDVVLIVGVTKGGKSLLALTIADNYTRRGIPVGYFSMEMPILELEQRRLCMRANIEDWSFTEYEREEIALNKVQGGYGITITDREAEMMRAVAETISHEPLHLVPPSLRHVRGLLLEAERLITQHGVKLLIFDHAQLARSTGNEYQTITELAQEVKALCNNYADRGVAALYLSQLNMEGQKVARAMHRVEADDAHGSSELSKSATIVTNMFIEKEKFTCGCPPDRQVRVEQVRIGKQMVTETRYLHEFKPTTGVCEHCRQLVREIPERNGGWYVERARSSAGGLLVPLAMTGKFMRLTEIV